MRPKFTSRAAELKALAIELAELVMESAKMDKIRAEEKGQWEVYIAEMEKGLNGMKLALKVLNEYYAKADKAHSSSDGASSGIIGLLEVYSDLEMRSRRTGLEISRRDALMRSSLRRRPT